MQTEGPFWATVSVGAPGGWAPVGTAEAWRRAPRGLRQRMTKLRLLGWMLCTRVCTHVVCAHPRPGQGLCTCPQGPSLCLPCRCEVRMSQQPAPGMRMYAACHIPDLLCTVLIASARSLFSSVTNCLHAHPGEQRDSVRLFSVTSKQVL